MAHILVVQWHSEIRSLMVLLLRQRGYEVSDYPDLASIPVDGEIPDLLCLDLVTPGLSEDDPLAPLRERTLPDRVLDIPLLITDVNGRVESMPGINLDGADGVFAPRTGRGFPFLVEIERLVAAPPAVPQPIHTWRLDKKELPAFLYACFLFGVSGVLTLRDRRAHKQLHLVDGWIRSASSSLENDWLGKLLLARRMTTPDALNQVERALATSKKKIGELFVERGFIDVAQLKEALRQQYMSITLSVFEWDWADVSLDEGEPNTPPHLAIHPFRLLVNGFNCGFTEAQVDAMLGAQELFPTPTVWTSFRFADVEFNEGEQQILQSINGQRSVAELVRRTGFSAEATKKFLLALAVMRGIVLAYAPRTDPAGFENQLQGAHHALIEAEFFRDVLGGEDPDDEPYVEDFESEGEGRWSWHKQLNFNELRESTRVLLFVLLAAVLVYVGIQALVLRDVEVRPDEFTPVPLRMRSNTVLIRKPIYERADRLLVDALIILRDKKWDGVDEARSLIGAALQIDPKFDAALNLRTSLELLADARFAVGEKRQTDAKTLLDQAYGYSPENPLVLDMMAELGLNPPAKTPAP